MTPFDFSCAGGGMKVSVIETNTMGSSVFEEDGTRGILLSGAHLSFVCGGFEEIHVEGFFAAEIRPSDCDVAARRHLVRMKLIAHGREGIGANYDVYIDNSGEEYEFERPWVLAFERATAVMC